MTKHHSNKLHLARFLRPEQQQTSTILIYLGFHFCLNVCVFLICAYILFPCSFDSVVFPVQADSRGPRCSWRENYLWEVFLMDQVKGKGKHMPMLASHQRKAALFFCLTQEDSNSIQCLCKAKNRGYIYLGIQAGAAIEKSAMEAEDICAMGGGIKDRQLTEHFWCHFTIFCSWVTHILFRYLVESVMCKTVCFQAACELVQRSREERV